MNNDVFDMIITDYKMLRMNGLKLLQIKSKTLSKNSPVVFISGNLIQELITELVKTESKLKNLAKPFTIEDLHRTVSSLT
tara:strand:+ start:511 stop:750 length:240 start_codon:yes stop_codon:yes gene_type:complete